MRVSTRSPRARALMQTDYPDLVQVGMIGLARAAQDFQPERGFKFSTFARWWLRHHVDRYVDNHASTVRVPVHAQEKRREQGKRGTAYVVSLNVPISTDNPLSPTRLDVLADESAPDLDETIDAKRAPGRVAELFAAAELTAQERRVLRMRTNDRTLLEIGAEIGVSRERVRQIERDALAKLRRAAGVRADAPRVSLSPKPRAPNGSAKRETQRRLRNESPCQTMQIDREPEA